MAQQGLQQILHSSCFKVVKKKQVKQKWEVKKIKSPFFPTKSENRFLSSDIVYLWKKILIHEKEHLDPWELISSKYLRSNFSFYSVLNGYGRQGFGTERARLGPFRGLGTERARLGPFMALAHIFLKMSSRPSKTVGFFLKLKFCMKN